MTKYIALAAFAGFLLPFQALMNARTSAILGNPLWPTLVNFIGGLILLVPLIMLLRLPLPAAEMAGRVPVYAWFTGLIGVVFVAQAAYTIPKLGAAGMISLAVTGQMFGSILFDHFGVLQEPDPVSLQKAIGAILLVAGTWLILRPAS
jgi:transporter family-2 protein